MFVVIISVMGLLGLMGISFFYEKPDATQTAAFLVADWAASLRQQVLFLYPLPA